MKAYTVYFFSQNKSSILYFPVDGKSKKAVLEMGKAMAAVLLKYYQSNGMRWLTKVTVKVEPYKP